MIVQVPPTSLYDAQNVSGRGRFPDHTGRAYDAAPDPLVGWGWGYVTLLWSLRLINASNTD
jgi:hypothetical protein